MFAALSLAVALAGQPPVAPPVDFAGPKPATIKAYADLIAQREAGFARTSVDRRFSSDDKVTGSLGFLCGLQPNAVDKGATTVYGVDPHGRFIGAKLKLSF